MCETARRVAVPGVALEGGNENNVGQFSVSQSPHLPGAETNVRTPLKFFVAINLLEEH